MKRYEWIFTAAALVMLIISACTGLVQPIRSDDLIRLHVIANSDSPEDQALKLHVRDRLLLTFGEKFKKFPSIEQAQHTIQANLSELEKVAASEINSRGFSYKVKAQLGTYPFPTRVYGDLVYPAGNYEALRLVIGEGQGANWWCVMFPPLCFVDVSSGIAEQPVEDSSWEAVQNSSPIEEQKTVIYTFKAAGLWKRLKEWINGLF